MDYIMRYPSVIHNSHILKRKYNSNIQEKQNIILPNRKIVTISDIKFSLYILEEKLLQRSVFTRYKYFLYIWKNKILQRKNRDFSKSHIIISPISDKSKIDYLEQKLRIKKGMQHCWDDSKNNTAIKGDLFGYVKNASNGDSIYIYEIIDVRKPEERLESWSANVGQSNRNVILLGKQMIYEGQWSEFKKICGYSENYNCQGTIRIKYDKSYQFINKFLS